MVYRRLEKSRVGAGLVDNDITVETIAAEKLHGKSQTDVLSRFFSAAWGFNFSDAKSF